MYHSDKLDTETQELSHLDLVWHASSKAAIVRMLSYGMAVRPERRSDGDSENETISLAGGGSHFPKFALKNPIEEQSATTGTKSAAGWKADKTKAVAGMKGGESKSLGDTEDGRETVLVLSYALLGSVLPVDARIDTNNYSTFDSQYALVNENGKRVETAMHKYDRIRLSRMSQVLPRFIVFFKH